MPRFWYAAYTVSPDPKKLKEKFKKANVPGISVFVPRIAEKRIIKKKIHVRPMFYFPGYFFIKFDRKMQDIHELEKMFGVHVLCHIIHKDGGKQRVPARVKIDVLRAIKDELAEHKEDEKRNYNTLVDKDVVIKEGPFRDFSGKCVGVTSNGVADVMVKFFDRSISAKVNADFLEIL